MPNWKHRPALDGGVITPPPLEKLLRIGSEVHKMAEGERGTGQAKNCPRGNPVGKRKPPGPFPLKGPRCHMEVIGTF